MTRPSCGYLAKDIIDDRIQPRRPVNREGRLSVSRVTIVWAFTSLAVAAMLIALVYGNGTHRSSGAVEPVQPISSIDLAVNESTAIVPQRSPGRDQNLADSETPPNFDSASNSNVVDEETDRKMVREESTQDIQRVYPLLLKNLNLTSNENDALLALLIEDLVATTRTRYSDGIGMDEQERSDRIAAIIGQDKLQPFLELERNLSSYRDVGRVGPALQQSGVPLTDAQKDGLVEIFITVRNQQEWEPPSDLAPNTIERLEYRLTLEDEYDRLVLELAPSVLSSRQVQYLFDRYEASSYQRANALERQRQQMDDPSRRDIPLMYPSRK